MKNHSVTEGLSQSAYFLILEAILKGKLPLGITLSRRKLAEEFGMSLLPVGEALQRLELEGLVESRPRVGTRVRIPSAQDIRGHYMVREAIECQAARLFAEKASRSERLEVQEMAAQLDAFDSEDSSRKGDLGEDRVFDARRRHYQFHMRITECTGCQALCEAIEKIHILLLSWVNNSSFIPDPGPNRFDCRPYPSPRWHQDLVDALLTRDPLEADKAMRQHVRFGMERMLSQLGPYLGGHESHVHTWSRRSPTLANEEDRQHRQAEAADLRSVAQRQGAGGHDRLDQPTKMTTTGGGTAEGVYGVADSGAKDS